jgi:hypothetical protein
MSWGRPQDTGRSKRMLRKAYALAEEIGLNDDDRHDLADRITEGSKSWRRMDEQQLEKLLWMLEGYVLIEHTLYNKKVGYEQG